jgi:hypothetical protein
MPSDDQPSIVPPAQQHPTAVDELFRQAEPLSADERLRLVARLWSTLPRDHRAKLVTLQLHDQYLGGDKPVHLQPTPAGTLLWPKIHERLFALDSTSRLYSAPRRFDLATIFVVTAAFSLMLGALTAMGLPAIVKVVFAALFSIVATTQALFLKVANPRGVSIITGMVAYTVISWCIWMSVPYVFESFFVTTFINGIFGGAILGYLFGTLVGGVFLTADHVRRRFFASTDPNQATPNNID